MFSPEIGRHSVMRRSEDSGNSQTPQEFTYSDSSPRTSSQTSPTLSYPTKSRHVSFAHPEFTASPEGDGESLDNEEDTLYSHTSGGQLSHAIDSRRSVSQREINLSRPSQEIRRKSQAQKGSIYASAPRHYSLRNRDAILSQQANVSDDLEGLQTQELMYSPSFGRKSIVQPTQIFNELDMSGQDSGEHILQHNVTAEDDCVEFEDDGLDQQNLEMLQSSIQEYTGTARPEVELFMEQGPLLNENHDVYYEKYDDGEGARDAIKEDNGASEIDEMHKSVAYESYTLSRKSRGKSMVQEFIYPSSRGSFEKDGRATDQEEKQLFNAEANDVPSSLRFFSRLSTSDSNKDLTKQQTQELMYSPSFAKESARQNVETETNRQDILQRPEGKESASERRKSSQLDLKDQKYKQEIHLPVSVDVMLLMIVLGGLEQFFWGFNVVKS